MKKSKLIVLVLSFVFAGIFLLTSENLFKADNAKDRVIVNGVYIGGIDVSGMTVQEATDAVNSYVDSLKEQTIILDGPKSDMELTYADLGLTANVSAAVEEAASIAQYGNLLSRFMHIKDLEKEKVVVEMGLTIDKQLVGNLIYDKLDELNIEAVDNTVIRKNGKFEYVAGSAGDEVVIEDSVNALSALVSKDYEVKLPEEEAFKLVSKVLEPRGTEEELAKIKDLLGGYSTDYANSSNSRKKNVENGANKINGTVLFPGEEFSVYAWTSPYTIENGYGVGSAYLNGESVDSIGGGICQVASTIYNAALLSELKITKRMNHSMSVPYGGVSGDAAISGTYKDLRFVNSTDTPIYIEAVHNGFWITFNIYGEETRPENRTIKYEGEIVKQNPSIAPKFKLNEEEPVGHYKVIQADHPGFTAQLWKYVYVDGVETEKTLVNKSYYIDASMIAEIGTKGATAEQLAAIKAAIATGNADEVERVVASYAPPAPPAAEEGAGDGAATEDGATTDENTSSDATNEEEESTSSDAAN